MQAQTNWNIFNCICVYLREDGWDWCHSCQHWSVLISPLLPLATSSVPARPLLFHYSTTLTYPPLLQHPSPRQASHFYGSFNPHAASSNRPIKASALVWSSISPHLGPLMLTIQSAPPLALCFALHCVTLKSSQWWAVISPLVKHPPVLAILFHPSSQRPSPALQGHRALSCTGANVWRCAEQRQELQWWRLSDCQISILAPLSVVPFVSSFWRC